MISGLLQYEFLQNAFITGIIIGVLAPLLGVFIVVRRMSMIADALSHVALAGIAFSLLLQKSFVSLVGLYIRKAIFGSDFNLAWLVPHSSLFSPDWIEQ